MDTSCIEEDFMKLLSVAFVLAVCLSAGNFVHTTELAMPP